MVIQTSYPGIYIQELPSSSHSIAAAPTNIAVFIGYTHPLKTRPQNWGKPVRVLGMADYQREFGGLVRSAAYAVGGDATDAAIVADPTLSFGDMAAALSQFFLNGGTQAYVVGLKPSAAAFDGAVVDFGPVTLTAMEVVDARMKMSVAARAVDTSFTDIVITYGPVTGPGTATETFRRVSLAEKIGTKPNPDYVLTKLAASRLVTATMNASGSAFPTAAPVELPSSAPGGTAVFAAKDFTDAMVQDGGLDKLPVFNLMVVPGVVNALVLSTALAFCERKRAFLIVDPPITASSDGSISIFPRLIEDVMNDGDGPPAGSNAALYFPYLQSPDPLTGLATNAVTGKTNEIPPAPTVAGLFAATDLARGVWKAPAGFQTTALNTTGVVERGRMTEMRQGTLNPIGVNCLRDFPNIGTAVFGARTLVTLTEEQWRYVPVRRTALFLEQSLLASLGWVVFEPNDEPLWSAIRMSINAFMLGLFRQGAFQGVKPSEAFYVQCDSQTTTQADIDNGVVNIVVAFAPLKPAEFVVISIAQLAGQAQTP